VVLSVFKIVAVLLIVAGIAGLIYGKVTYTKTAHETKLGPFDFSIKEKKAVDVPLWAGVLAIVAGALLLVIPRTGGPK
jgi:hypothetical protein